LGAVGQLAADRLTDLVTHGHHPHAGRALGFGLEATQLWVDAAAAQPEQLAAATQTTGFRIAPFLAGVAGPVPWRHQEGEIAEVVELPVADLARPEVGAEEVRAFPTWPAPRRIRLWRVGCHEVWGVTYRILEPLVPRLLGGEWPL
jgi:hypothetical protein